MDSKKKSYAIQALRRASLKWKPRNTVKNKGRKQFPITRTTKKGVTSTRMIWHYTCAHCGPDVWHRDKDITMDHVNPVVDVSRGFTNFDDYIDRMFVYEDGWQRLCQLHHDLKTEVEQDIRKEEKPKKEKKKKK